jgi:hypothetical protein
MKPIFILWITVLTFTACKKDKATPVSLTGAYTGKLYSTSTGVAQADAKLVIADKTYNASLNTPFAAGSRGSYVVNDKEINFTDSLVHTANFDWGLLLNGKYTSAIKGDSLILVKKGAGYSYTYRLKKE